MPQVKITDRERDTLPGAIASLGADTGTDLTLVCRLVQTILHISTYSYLLFRATKLSLPGLPQVSVNFSSPSS